MFDTVYFRLYKEVAGDVDLLTKIPCCLNNVGEHYFNNEPIITGDLNGLKISLNTNQLKVKDGSLCKWFLGDNFKTMGRSDTQKAIEKLSDILHLPMDKASVTRLDVAQNFITMHPPEVYFNHLGELRYTERLLQPSGLYYKGSNLSLCFYDKNKEQKSHRRPIPDLYQNRNVLRYEQRYTSRVASQMRVSEVTGALLYDEAFYQEVLNRWRAKYEAIQKVNDISLNFEAMKTKQQLYKMGVLSIVQMAGGAMKMYEQIREAQNQGKLTKKQAFDLRKTVKDALEVREGLTVQNEAIKELNKKVAEAIKYYR